ncbi:internal virion protein A [Pseudomonas phage 10P302A]|uniref:Internal virion protein A n=1 Tax=Pseudomonas phage 10P302A TaxID=3038233 RepID=A0AAF0K2E6_9CAUD|nr:internal virion protein A [Pseudomonas phage 10P302A]
MILQKAKLWHLEAAARDLSPGDLQEFHSHTAGRDPRDIIPTCLDETTLVITKGALVVAVGGSKNCLWFVTTNVVDLLTKAERMEFYRILKGHLSVLRLQGHQSLTNFVSVDNHAHIRLLNALGATFAREHSMSPAGCRFRQFWL